jgi:tetraacyldisaccharide 4'-kinase
MLSDGREVRVAPQWSLTSGDEPAWLAATCTGVPVGVHPDRSRSAAAILERYDIDIFLLDDGFQTVLYRDLDLVLLDPSEDPPFAHRSLCREGEGALRRAHHTAVILRREQAGGRFGAWPQLLRTPTSLRLLDSGETASADTAREVVVAAAVGQPGSVADLARESGLTVSAQAGIDDHGELSRRAWRKTSRHGVPLLITEKDAVGWAGRRRPPGPSALVLSMPLAGSQNLADKLLDELQAGALS